MFAADVDAVQLTWHDLGAGPVEVRTIPAADSTAAADQRLDTGEGPGSVQLEGLPPDQEITVIVDASHRGRWRRTVRTLAPLPGPELFRFATISDLHLGEERFGFLGRMSEGAAHPEPYTVRAAKAAVDEIEAWGAQLLVAKGDLTDSGRQADWDQFAAVTAHRRFPVLAVPGNHDTWGPGRSMLHPLRRRPSEAPDAPRLSPGEGLARLGLDHDPITVRDEPGVRIVAVDTTRPDSRAGRIAHLAEEVVDTVAASSRPAVVILHHQLMATPVPTHLPIGIARAEADPFLDALARAHPATLVTSGHTHRHRRRDHGPVVVTEVGSTKDYPGTWAGYVVHEGGIRQVVRRVAAPDVLAWTDRSAAAALGLWGRWSPGCLADRCFTHPWPTH